MTKVREKELERLIEEAQEELTLLKEIDLGYNIYENVDDKILKAFGKPVNEHEAIKQIPKLISNVVREITLHKRELSKLRRGGDR